MINESHESHREQEGSEPSVRIKEGKLVVKDEIKLFLALRTDNIARSELQRIIPEKSKTEINEDWQPCYTDSLYYLRINKSHSKHTLNSRSKVLKHFYYY